MTQLHNDEKGALAILLVQEMAQELDDFSVLSTFEEHWIDSAIEAGIYEDKNVSRN